LIACSSSTARDLCSVLLPETAFLAVFLDFSTDAMPCRLHSVHHGPMLSTRSIHHDSICLRFPSAVFSLSFVPIQPAALPSSLSLHCILNSLESSTFRRLYLVSHRYSTTHVSYTNFRTFSTRVRSHSPFTKTSTIARATRVSVSYQIRPQ
jgi:hypothetical protein